MTPGKYIRTNKIRDNASNRMRELYLSGSLAKNIGGVGKDNPMMDPSNAMKVSKSKKGKKFPKISKALKGRSYGDLYGVKLSMVKRKRCSERLVQQYKSGKRKIAGYAKLMVEGKLSGDNNPSKRPDVRNKSSETKLRQFRTGQIKAWNIGKTHLEDPRILSGENIHTFNNWSSFEPYGKEFNKKLRADIRTRDKHICQLCGKSQIKMNYLLDIHHIDYNKNNNFPINLISLCRNCHSKTNTNRLNWKIYFYKINNPIALISMKTNNGGI